MPDFSKLFSLEGVLGLLNGDGKKADGFKAKWEGSADGVTVKTFAAKPLGLKAKKIKLFVKVAVAQGGKPDAIHTIDAVYDTASGQPDRDVIKVDGKDTEHEDIKFGYGVKGQLFPPKAIVWAKIKLYWTGGDEPDCEVSYEKSI